MGYSQPEQQAKQEAQDFAQSVFSDFGSQKVEGIMGLYSEILRFYSAVNAEIDSRKVLSIQQMAGVNAGFIASIAVFIVNTGLKTKLIDCIERLEAIDAAR